MDVFAESFLRANIVAWLPIRREDSVLYIGDNRVVADKLGEMSGDVSCIGCDGPLPEEAAYDVIVCPQLAGTKRMGEFFSHLKESGRLVFTAENAYGLKYLAGAKETGSQEYFGAVEALEGSAGVTREELKEGLRGAGFAREEFYYPFPDDAFAMSIYSDGYLPKAGELMDQVGNFDAERLVLFDEAKAADALVARGKFGEFSSAFLVVAGKGEICPASCEGGERMLFVKFSNDRGIRRNIRTYITESADGTRHLIKMADTKAADAQIGNMANMADALAGLYAGSRFSVNTCVVRDTAGAECQAAEFAYLQGCTMEELMDGMLARGEYEKAADQLNEVLLEIAKCRGQEEFQATEEFREVFGEPALPGGLLAAPVSDIDMILSNILVDADGGWTLIDYEWSFAFPIPVHFILYRCIRYYVDTTKARKRLSADLFYQKAGMKEQELLAYEAMEEAFQAYVLDGHAPLRQLYREYGKPAYHISSVLHVVDEMERRSALQVYFDRGSGFSEEESVIYHSKALDGTYHLRIPVAEDVKGLRIDPGSQACTVELMRLCFAPERAGVMEFISNGHKMAEDMYLFDTKDPNMLLTKLPAGEKTLLLDLRMDAMSLAAAEWIAPKIDAKYRLKKMWKK